MLWGLMQAWCVFAYLIDDDSLDLVLGPTIVLLMLCALVWNGYRLYRRLRLRYGSSRWTMTEAVIQSEFAGNATSPSLHAALGGSLTAAAASNLFHPVLQYSYQVAGEFYSGYFMLGELLSSREDASAAARPWLEKKIFVRYNPERPHESAFLRDDGAPPGSRSFGDQPPASPAMITLSLK